jgi:ATP-dependent RNA helicase DDX51/DBP6
MIAAQGLSTRVIRRVRALVVLPTHDLAQQVAAVMRSVCGAVGLDVAVVAGKGSLRPEADALVRSLLQRWKSCES